MLIIDGSMGEGGGQVLRTALSFSCMKGVPVTISNIRAGRETPGLRPQHLTVCKLLAEICGAKMSGAEIGSTKLVFEPGEISGGDYSFDIGTAGSCTLLLQAALPVLLSAGSRCNLRITGGTHVRGAPTYEYFSEVFLPAIAKFGAKCESKLVSAGFYPKGGGEIELRTQPSKFSGAEFLPQEHAGAGYSIISSGIPPHVAEREEKTVKERLSRFLPSGKKHELPSACPGNSLTIWSGCIGASALGERGKSAEKVADEACDSFLAEAGSGAAVDSHLADQLLLYAVVAKGGSSFSTSKFSQHLTTNAEVLRAMGGRNIILGDEGMTRVL